MKFTKHSKQLVNKQEGGDNKCHLRKRCVNANQEEEIKFSEKGDSELHEVKSPPPAKKSKDDFSGKSRTHLYSSKQSTVRISDDVGLDVRVSTGLALEVVSNRGKSNNFFIENALSYCRCCILLKEFLISKI